MKASLFGAVAARLRLTEGQLYSSVITVVAAAVLATGLGHVHGVSSALSAPVDLPALTQPATVAVPPPVVATAPQLIHVTVPATAVSPISPINPPTPQWPSTSVPTQGPTPTPSPTTKPTPCTLQAVSTAADSLITTLTSVSGGRLPDKDLKAVVGLVTGCAPASAAVVAIGLLIGVGHALPDPGLPNPPAIPFIAIPAPVVAALQPARPAIDAACGLVGTGQTVTSLFISAYPRPIPQLTTQVLFQALAVCGQVRKP